MAAIDSVAFGAMAVVFWAAILIIIPLGGLPGPLRWAATLAGRRHHRFGHGRRAGTPFVPTESRQPGFDS